MDATPTAGKFAARDTTQAAQRGKSAKAGLAHAAAINEARALLAAVEAEITRLENHPDASWNWGVSGSLNHANAQMREIIGLNG